MKTKISTIALIAMLSISSHLLAQEGVVVAQERVVRSAGWDLAKNIRCRVIPTETGFSIAFEYDAKLPAAAMGDKSAGKKGYDYYKAISEYSVSASDNTITEIKRPRDAASGLATGKRQHKPIAITKEIDKSTPILYNSVSGNVTNEDTWEVRRSIGGSAGKVNIQDISFTKRCAGTTTVYSVVNDESVIPTGDCPNGDCNLKIIWTWNDGSANTEIGSSGMDGVSRYSVDFVFHIEDGVSTDHAINTKGTGGTKTKDAQSLIKN